jgi:phage-related protein
VISDADMLISKYYRDARGTIPVKEFIDRLEPEVRSKVYRHIARLNQFGDALGYPYTSQVAGELRELRCWFGRRHLRIYYRRSGPFAVLLHIIDKRGDKLPPAETRTANARWADFKARMDSELRTPPRALGPDAP